MSAFGGGGHGGAAPDAAAAPLASPSAAAAGAAVGVAPAASGGASAGVQLAATADRVVLAVEPEPGNQAPAPGAATALSAALSPPRSPGGGSTLPLLPSLRRSPRHQAPPASRGGRRRAEPDADPRRAPDAMRAACRTDGVADPELPMGFPCGPWLAANDAEAAIHNWCLDSKTGGGGWGISKRSSRPSNTVRGAQVIYACHFYSPNKRSAARSCWAASSRLPSWRARLTPTRAPCSPL